MSLNWVELEVQQHIPECCRTTCFRQWPGAAVVSGRRCCYVSFWCNTATLMHDCACDLPALLLVALQYGRGICFQSRLADGVSGPSCQQSLLKLTGNPWLKDNKAEVRHSMTQANIVPASAAAAAGTTHILAGSHRHVQHTSMLRKGACGKSCSQLSDRVTPQNTPCASVWRAAAPRPARRA